MLREIARRRLAKGQFDIGVIEELAEKAQKEVGEETLVAAIAAMPPEDDSPKACPKCGRQVPVKVRNRPRHILTVAGELRISRNYHHCACGTGFYPRDLELKLPEKGEVSDAMERRILDFGINDTFESVAERWSIHYPTTISSNLVRRVMDRVGLRCEAASSEEQLQRASQKPPEELATVLVVATDGSYLLARFNLSALGYIEPLPGIPPSATHILKLVREQRGRKGVILHTVYQGHAGIAQLPALQRPTISSLSDPDWVAVNTIVEEKTVRTLIPRLKAAGGQGIVEYPLNKIVL